ncbi:acyl-CoA dehydrogenase [Actinomadura madurae]|uniref:acyl-CoA dehydrogenase family protein n=1 Tax=Actinomadura madurae TaxID=1993 RepID=UPI00399A598C
MIDLDLNDVEAGLLGEVARQAEVYRTYSRRFDRPQDHTVPSSELYPIPEEADFPNVRAQLREVLDQTSGWMVMDALIYVQENYGAKPFFPRPAGADGFDANISKLLLAAVGDEEQNRKWGADYGFLAWGMTESGAGSDPAGMRTTAVFDEGTKEWVLNGEKIFISFVEEAEAILTLARVGSEKQHGSIGLFMVEKNRPGFRLGKQYKKLGIRDRDLGSFSLEDYRIPEENRLGGSLTSALSTFNGTRALMGAEALGLTRAALDIVRDALVADGLEIDYWRAPGDLNADVQRYIELEAEYEAGYLTLLHSMWFMEQHGPDKVQAAIAKVVCAGMARALIPECFRLLGPSSTSRDHFLERALRDSRITDIYEGPGVVLRLLIARNLLGFSSRELN